MTDCDFDEELKPLLAKAGSLVDAMTRVDARLQAVERSLSASGARVELWVPIGQEDASRPEGAPKPVIRKVSLGWCELAGEWRLRVKADLYFTNGVPPDEHYRDDGAAVPVGEVGLEVRILAAAQLPALLRRLDRRLAELLGLTRESC